MFKLIKYLKPFSVKVFIIIALLLVQAACDLSLPDYTSNIVNVGIQQGGIENAVPDAIRKSEFDKLLIFMNEEEKMRVSENYRLLDRENMSQVDYQVYEKQYPKLSEQSIYTLNTRDKKK